MNLQTTGKHAGACFHDYDILRVVWELPNEGFLVLGSDNRFHVVHKDCTQGQKAEIKLDLK